MIMPKLLRIAAWPVAVLLFTLAPAGCNTSLVRPSGRVVVQDQNTRVEVVFNDHDREHIHRYYESKHRKYYKKGKKKTPPGLAKKERLPPGLEKQLHRKGHLPPGLQGRGLPAELERELTPLPPGYVRIQVGGDIVLADERTRVIFDVIHGIAL